jgi:hypothetical protein
VLRWEGREARRPLGDYAAHRPHGCGGGGYQQMSPPEKRLQMTINGEAVAEIDIKASHLTIYHAKLKCPLSRDSDPYETRGRLPGSTRGPLAGNWKWGWAALPSNSKGNKEAHFGGADRLRAECRPAKRVSCQHAPQETRSGNALVLTC